MLLTGSYGAIHLIIHDGELPTKQTMYGCKRVSTNEASSEHNFP